jgi:hypothetical protein
MRAIPPLPQSFEKGSFTLHALRKHPAAIYHQIEHRKNTQLSFPREVQSRPTTVSTDLRNTRKKARPVLFHPVVDAFLCCLSCVEASDET